MGYYTRLKFSCQLKPDAPFDVLEKLCNDTMWKAITGEEQPVIGSVEDVPNLPIDHPFGKTHRWSQIFTPNTATLNVSRKTLKIDCDIKAYENDYQKLVDWLKPYIVLGTAKTKGEDTDYWIKIL